MITPYLWIAAPNQGSVFDSTLADVFLWDA
jgi:hypothetical protein